jgi:hypothetical protein
VRTYLTTWLWYEDRLCCLPAVCLFALTILSASFLTVLGLGARPFLDDLTFLFVDNDLTTAVVLAELVLLASAGLWLLSCCLAALARRLLLYIRGL